MSDIAELEQQITGNKELVERGKMAQRLASNRDFKKLILDDFCVQECARYAQVSADPNLPANERADALAIAQAAGHLRRWLQVVNAMGHRAQHEIGRCEAEIDMIRAEGGDD